MNVPTSFSDKKPIEIGYRMPAEWEKHDSVWIAWPHDPTTFPSRVNEVENIYLRLVKLIHTTEKVNLFVKDQAMKEKTINLFKKEKIDLTRIRFFQFDYADVWFRDYGPTFVTNGHGELAMVHWVFNSWGKKYEELLKDRRIVGYIHDTIRIPCFEPRIVLEGGSIDTNGKGTLLTTEQCLLNKNRNPQLTQKEIESYLMDYLSVNKVIWLKKGIMGDDTDGHIDDIARFVNSSTVVCAFEGNKDDENYSILKENYELLLGSVDQDGKKLNIIKLPMPFVVGDNSKRLPASYTNFYIGNKTVLVPIFKNKNDHVALSILQNLFPDRKVYGINCVSLIYGFGAIHCITQQQPMALS